MKELYEAAPSWREWKLVDIIYGIVIPSIVALLIIGVSMVSTPSLIGLKYPLLEAVAIVGCLYYWD
jgi:hypothetical protein